MQWHGKFINVYGIWRNVIKMLEDYPSLIAPFAFIGALDMIILGFLLSLPLFSVLPAGSGEGLVRHHPGLGQVPRLFAYCKDITGLFSGVIFTGMAIFMVAQVKQDKRPEWKKGMKRAFKKYIPLALVWGSALVAMIGMLKIVDYIYPLALSPHLGTGLGLLLSLAIQMVLIYSLPSVVIENKKTFAALRRSWALFKNHPIETGILVSVPNLFVSPLAYLYVKMDILTQQYTPEVVFSLMGFRTILLVIVNFLVISSATVLFMRHKQYEKGILYGNGKKMLSGH